MSVLRVMEGRKPFPQDSAGLGSGASGGVDGGVGGETGRRDEREKEGRGGLNKRSETLRTLRGKESLETVRGSVDDEDGSVREVEEWLGCVGSVCCCLYCCCCCCFVDRSNRRAGRSQTVLHPSLTRVSESKSLRGTTGMSDEKTCLWSIQRRCFWID